MPCWVTGQNEPLHCEVDNSKASKDSLPITRARYRVRAVRTYMVNREFLHRAGDKTVCVFVGSPVERHLYFACPRRYVTYILSPLFVG